MPTVLITGANGFIGKKCIRSLLRKNVRIYATDSTYCENADQDPNFTYIQCEITDKDAITSILESNKIDSLIHLANSVDNDFDSYVTDVELKRAKITDKYIYEAAVKCNVKNILLLSTTQVYGTPKGREPIRESSPTKGSSNYVDLKLLSEKMLEKAVKKSDTVPVVARVAPIYTSEYTQNLRDKVYDAKEDVAFIYNDGLYGFSFCCVYNLTDFIRGIVAIPTGRYEGIYNVCDNDVITAKQILDFERDHHRVGAVVQRSPGTGISFNKAKAKTDYRYFDPATTFNNWRLDNTRAKRIAPLKWNLGNTK